MIKMVIIQNSTGIRIMNQIEFRIKAYDIKNIEAVKICINKICGVLNSLNKCT
jgi:hypothetical protein